MRMPQLFNSQKWGKKCGDLRELRELYPSPHFFVTRGPAGGAGARSLLPSFCHDISRVLMLELPQVPRSRKNVEE